VLAGWTFLLIIAGLWSQHDAGLSYPIGDIVRFLVQVPKLVGGVKFEHTHRMIAQVAGLLTIVLAIWTWRVESAVAANADWRRWDRRRSGILGALRCCTICRRRFLRHAALAQTFFCIAVAMAVFTGRDSSKNSRMFGLTSAAQRCYSDSFHFGSVCTTDPGRHVRTTG